MTRESPLMEVQGIRSFEIPGTGSNAFLWRQTATSRPKTAAFAKKTAVFEINMKHLKVSSKFIFVVEVKLAIVNFDPDSVYGLRAGFQQVLLVSANDKQNFFWKSSFWKSFLTRLSINQIKETRLVISLFANSVVILAEFLFTWKAWDLSN